MALPKNRGDLEYKKFVEDASGEVAVRTQLTVQDIHIGQVELKDGETATFGKIKSDGTDNALVVTQNTQPLPTGAATEATLATIDADTSSLAGCVDGTEVQVDVVSSALPTGAATETKQDDTITAVGEVEINQTDGSQKTQIVDGSGNVIGSTGNALDVNIASGVTLEVNLDPDNDGVEIYGSDDGGSTQRLIKTDAAGELQIDVLSSALPTGAATEASLALVNADTTNIAFDTTSLDAKVPSQGTALMAESLPVTISTDDTMITALDTAIDSIDGKITACNTGAVVIASGACTVDATDLDIRALSGTTDEVDLSDDANRLVGKVDCNGSSVAATCTNAGTFAVQAAPNRTVEVTNATGSGAIATTTALNKKFRLSNVTVHLSAVAATPGESLVISVDANDGAEYDTILYSMDMEGNSVQDLVYTPTNDLIFEQGDEVKVAYTNTDGNTYGLRIVTEAI